MKDTGKSYSIALASATLIFVFSILMSSVASGSQVTRIGNGTDPTIYGNKVVWTSGGVIHLYDLTSKTDTTVSSSAASHPAIYGNVVVWHDESNGMPRLTVYDIKTAGRSYITKDVDNRSIPAIYDNRIVWSAYNESTHNPSIYMRDISNSTQTWIAEGEGYSSDIYGTKIVYSAEGRSMRDIFLYDITTKKTITVSPYSGSIQIPHMYGNKVIWVDNYIGSGYIGMYDVVTKKATKVTSDHTVNTLNGSEGLETGCDTGTHFDINGDKIVYSKSADNQFGYAGVYVYDIPSAKSTPVYIYPRGADTTPDIYNDTIVWGIDGDHGGYGGVNDTGIYICDLSVTNTLPPVAEFTANRTYGAAPLVVLFTDTSTGEVPTSWIWDFGDWTYSKHAMNATYTFTKPENYTISLTAGNDAGSNKVVKPNYIVVTNPFLVANFSSNVTHGYPLLSVQFTDLSQNATGWNWDFGDGSNSTQRSPVHEYADPGIYSVNLTATNENGTDSKLTTITVMQLVGVGPYAYITNSGDNNISVIDTATNKVTAMIPVGSQLGGVAITLDGKKVYVTNYYNISVIDATKNKVTATIPVGNYPSGVAVSPDGKRIYVPNPDFGNPSNNTILIINTDTNEVEATVLVGEFPFGVAVTLDGKKVYVTNLDDKTVSVIDTSTNTVIATIPVGDYPRGVAISPDGKRVYVTNSGSNSVSIINTDANTVTATVPVGNWPKSIAVTPDGKKVYVANYGSISTPDDTVSVIDIATNMVTATVHVGSYPSGVAVTPDGSRVYVANQRSDNVSIIDTATNKVTATMNVGRGPNSFGQFIGSLQA
ncbi:cell surface protein [Methanosarcina barkeri str. Wiesmoor]|uniref:Cell surface protein n=2 Tax=Methanosarcina barkeri TaxID=2208 RepID=A0A0E3QMB2_METBA|nr:PKD domain-containing protein [Methanosarcina barkeri]AKB50848.1 cell surface protein [Methanosarcina barkeri str. Wiesmoor]